MDYNKKLKEYRIKIKNKETLKFVEFLEILYDWIDFLTQKKRISIDQEKNLISHFPTKIFEKLDKVSPTELSLDYEDLKELLLKETSNFLISVIKSGNVKMVDFDSIQFNLYGIFGKEKIASMVEHVRLSLEANIEKQKVQEIEKRTEKEQSEKAWLEKIKTMPDKKLIKIITKSLFSFSPSARTNEERLQAIKNNQRIVNSQKKKFHKFEQKLVDATENARGEAQTNVNRQIGEVKREVDNVSNIFKEKAKEFISNENLKKKLLGARKMIEDQRDKLTADVDIERIKFKEKGKNWKNEFNIKIEGAKKRIEESTYNLSKKGGEKRELISSRAHFELDKAGIMIKKETVEFESNIEIAKQKFSGKAEMVSERGKSELNKARKMIFKEKSEFIEDVDKVKVTFDKTGRIIDSARTDFQDKSISAASKFSERGDEIETDMNRTITKGKEKFETNREIAQQKFHKRAIEISASAKKHIDDKKTIFVMGRDSAKKRFLTKSEGIKGNDIIPSNDEELEGATKLSSGAQLAKGKIGKAHSTMMEKAGLNREKMKEEMIRKRELFLYDVRFAQHQIQENAKRFSEKVAEKREEFEIAQEKLVARHKAKQKAHLIQNLLRTIRSMH